MGTVAIRAVIKRAIPAGDSIRIYGWAALSRNERGEPIVDAQGDWIPVAELEKAAQRALLDRGGRAAIGVNHEDLNLGDLVESFVVTDEKRKAFGLGDVPEGWMVGITTSDPEVVKAVRSGSLAEMSIRAQGRREPVALPEGKTWADILKRTDAPATVNVLRDLRLREIELLSIVDKGAGGDADTRPGIVLVTKRENMDNTEKRSVGAILAELLEAGKFADLPADDLEALVAEVARMNAAQAEAASEAAEQAAAATAPAPMVDVAMEEGDEKTEDAAKAEDDEKDKDEVAKRNVMLEKRVAELEAAAAHAKLCDIVKREYAYLPGASTEELARIVHEVRTNLGKSHARQLENVLKAASAAIKTGGLLEATSTHVETSATGGELHELAKALRNKNPELSASSALLEAGRARPDLWTAARKGR